MTLVLILYQKSLTIKMTHFVGHIFLLFISLILRKMLHILIAIYYKNEYEENKTQKNIYILLVPLQSVSKKVYEILNKFIAGKKHYNQK